MLNPNNFTNRFNTIADNGLPLVLNVKFHGIHETNGDDNYNINEERFLKVIASLNINFNQFNIFFKYRGYGIINNSEYVGYSPDMNLINTLVGLSTQQGDYSENAINIFINNSGTISYGNNNILMSTTIEDAVAGLGISPFYDYHVCNIMGHTLGLLEINEGVGSSPVPVTNNVPACIGAPFMSKAYFTNNPAATYQPENVTRDPSDTINYNADIAGDMVVDTQAFFQQAYTNYCGNNLLYFQQHPEVVDKVGIMYNCTAAESHNYMVHWYYNGKPNSFTPGQGARMRQFIINPLGEIN
ncbi:MAG: hypothetical protein CFE24_12415 [Flavobacterium sp. BFFFF2]|nr:MAG: hypothetical protein CFE24_12415 [Flavobacterium sp. BFFFF2]